MAMKEFEYNGKAMGTDFSIAIICSSQELADRLEKEAEDEINEYERRFSRFLPDSELSILNREKDMLVSEIFMKIVLASREFFYLTKGIFNPLLQIERLGYDRNFDDLKIEDDSKKDELYNIDFSSTIIDREKSRIILGAGQKLDFGGFLKGYLSELLCKKIKSASDKIEGVIVNIGGDIYTEGLDAEGGKFIFKIYNPITRDDISVPIFNEALATSGTYKRNWKKENLTVHHILDISGTQNPISDVVSASLITRSGGKSEAYAKVFLSLGPEKALEILKDDDIKFIIIKKDGQIIKNI
jgi:thiamine biosynthesis lipoprotein